MMQRLRQRLTWILLALLPFHALLVTVGTRIILGPGHAPWAPLALWKECLLGVIMALATAELVIVRKIWRMDLLDALVCGMAVIAVVLSATLRTPPSLIALGARYDFLPQIVFVVMRRVPWSEEFERSLMRLLVAVGLIVAMLGILSLFLPLPVFVWLGYSDLHSLYLPQQPLAPYQQIGESVLRRIQGPMSGPNQLGLWLLLPWSALVVSVLAGVRRGRSKGTVLIGAIIILALLLTLSRAAWIATAVILAFALAWKLSKRAYRRLLIFGGGSVALCLIIATLALPQVFFRLSSTRGHLVRPLEAIGMIVRHPFGQGLGSAGPAMNRVSDTCVLLRPQDDPGWAKSQPELCVFLGTIQVQPKDRTCHCPFLPENWYLQIGVELGVLGMALFVTLVTIILLRLRRFAIDAQRGIRSMLGATAFLAFLGIGVAGCFLHVWEDAAVAYSGWLLVAVSLSPREAKS